MEIGYEAHIIGVLWHETKGMGERQQKASLFLMEPGTWRWVNARLHDPPKVLASDHEGRIFGVSRYFDENFWACSQNPESRRMNQAALGKFLS